MASSIEKARTGAKRWRFRYTHFKIGRLKTGRAISSSNTVSGSVSKQRHSGYKLLAIGKLILGDQNYRLSDNAEKAREDYIDKRREQPHFANARSIRNALDRARVRQATRLFDCRAPAPTTDDLMTIEADEILASRVFQGGIGGDNMKDEE